MAKKTRKARKTSGPMIVQPPAAPAAGQTTPTTPIARPKAAPVQPARTMSMAQAAVTFREEYHYVLADLKRTAITAVALFATMIILALILGR